MQFKHIQPVVAVIAVLAFSAFAKGQSYISYFTGSTTDVTPSIPYYGTTLMGGATENDDAMRWFLNSAGGGDVLVLRATGSDGYNDYMYNQLGVTLNSVETIVMNNAVAATDPYVLQAVAEAEAIWFAGGDQWDYISYMKDTAMEDALNLHAQTKTLGGTSAGMAILGDYYFSAENGTITSAQALADPFDPNLTIGTDFLVNMGGVVPVLYETHFNNPDRMGRLMTFLARNPNLAAIALDEFVAVTIEKGQDINGYAQSQTKVYGDYPNFQDFAYFLTGACNSNFPSPEVVQPGQPLTWDMNQTAVQVHKVAASGGPGGSDTGIDAWTWIFDQTTAPAGSSLEYWYVVNGVLMTAPSTMPIGCIQLSVADQITVPIRISNPIGNAIQANLNGADADKTCEIYTLTGKQVYTGVQGDLNGMDASSWSSGVYLLKTAGGGVVRLIKE